VAEKAKVMTVSSLMSEPVLHRLNFEWMGSMTAKMQEGLAGQLRVHSAEMKCRLSMLAKSKHAWNVNFITLIEENLNVRQHESLGKSR
jgi:hypothetical protein